MTGLWIEFGRGGRFPVRLWDDDSPRNAAALRAVLPVQASVLHCSWSGQGFVFPVPIADVAAETLRAVGIRPGTICLEHYPAGARERGPWTAVLIVYGPVFWFKNPFTPSCTLSLIGQVEATANELLTIGERVHARGREAVSLGAGGG